jgi:hypothetical protein
MSNVSGIVKSIQDIMRKDVGVDGDAQRISQMVWMFFLKILDDREEELEMLEDNYQSPLPQHLRWRSWAKNKEGATGEGLADLLMVMVGLAQRYMTQDLALSTAGPGIGTVLEVKEERGLGTTLDVILYDGQLNIGDDIVVGAESGGVIETKIRSLLQPRPMQEILTEDRDFARFTDLHIVSL